MGALVCMAPECDAHLVVMLSMRPGCVLHARSRNKSCGMQQTFLYIFAGAMPNSVHVRSFSTQSVQVLCDCGLETEGLKRSRFSCKSKPGWKATATLRLTRAKTCIKLYSLFSTVSHLHYSLGALQWFTKGSGARDFQGAQKRDSPGRN